MSPSGSDILTDAAKPSMCANLHESCKFSSCDCKDTSRQTFIKTLHAQVAKTNITHLAIRTTRSEDEQSKVAQYEQTTPIWLLNASIHNYVSVFNRLYK